MKSRFPSCATPAHPGLTGMGHTQTGHYENFPVASWLCPPALRAPVRALYHFARTADDLADEGEQTAAQRLQALARYRKALDHAATGKPSPDAWPDVFGPLAQTIVQQRLPLPPLHDLLSAFEQDVRYTDAQHPYADLGALLDYSRRSANPVGRLVLHLCGIDDPRSLARSDDICTALQLINFWQDIRVDWARQRHYLPQDVLARHGLSLSDFHPDSRNPQASAAVAELCRDAETRLRRGAPLALTVPGRMGWELRLIVQGGLRVLEQLAAMDHASWRTRPRLRATDVPRLLWRALRMR